MRLFIAIELENLNDYFKELQQKLPKVKATYPKHFHLTLKFLGEVADNKLDEIKEKLKQIKFEPFKLKLGTVGVFSDEKFIRIVWIGLEDGEKINNLQKQIESALEGMFKKDNKFHPHITLARIKFVEEYKKEKFIKTIKSIKIEPKETNIENFKLIKSTLTGEGSAYEDLEVYG